MALKSAQSSKYARGGGTYRLYLQKSLPELAPAKTLQC